MCTDGSYCCNNDATCCSKKKGKFLDPSGNIISNPYTSKTSGTGASLATVTATSVAATTVHASPTANSSQGLSAAAEGVIGALAGVLALTLVAAGLFVWRKRRQIHNLNAKSTSIQLSPQIYDSYQHDKNAAMGFAPVELRGGGATNSPVRRELES